MSEKSVILLLESAEEGALETTRTELEQNGMVVEEVMPLMKTISGRIDEQAFESLKSVGNVKHVREEREFRLPPMDERVPQ